METYLSASNQQSLDISNHLGSPSHTNGSIRRKKHNNGTDTPRDLESRVKVLELYALHVLPRNEEWDYAQDFIKMNETLDEETREAFIQTLDDLQDQRNGTTADDEETSHDHDEEAQQELQEVEPRHEEESLEPLDRQYHTDDSDATLKSAPRSKHQRTHSEHDYGIETPRSKSPPPQSAAKPPIASRPSQSRITHSSPSTPRKKPSPPPSSLYKRTSTILLNLQHLIGNMTQSLSKNPMALLRFVFFLLGLVVALSRRDVKDRIAKGWDKVRQTVGMGVKVTYI